MMSERQAPTEPTVKPIVVTTPEHVHAWVDAIRASAATTTCGQHRTNFGTASRRAGTSFVSTAS
jgi:hypothetical protein